MILNTIGRTTLGAVMPALVVLCAVPCSAQGAAEDTAAEEEALAPVDPVAMELLTQSMTFVAGLENFSFSWFISSDEVVAGREKLTFVNSGTTIMARNRGFTSRTERGLTLRDFYFDGKTFVVSSPDQGFYASAPFEGTFDQLVDKARQNTDLELPLWTMLTDDLPERLTRGVSAAAYLEMTSIAGREVHHIAFVGGYTDWQVWISTDSDRPVPLMMVGTRTDQQGWPQFRVNLMDWETELEIADEDITFTPDEGMMRIAMPTFSAPKDDELAPEKAGAGS